MKPINRSLALHYTWGTRCDGWHLLDHPDLSVIEERMPPGSSEAWHFHRRARQFFFLLSGQAVFELDGVVYRLQPGDGIAMPPGMPHRIGNENNTDLRFLVVSAPHSHGDRVEVSP